MGVEGLRWVLKALMGMGGLQMGVNGLGWVWRGYWNLSGKHRVVWNVWDGYEGLGWVRRVWD